MYHLLSKIKMKSVPLPSHINLSPTHPTHLSPVLRAPKVKIVKKKKWFEQPSLIKSQARPFVLETTVTEQQSQNTSHTTQPFFREKVT